MSLWSSLGKLFAPRRIETRAELTEFLESRAAYLVQKSMAEYCQARTGLGYSSLIREASFQAAQERAKWLGYPAAFSMVAEAAAGYLHLSAAPADVERLLVQCAREVFGRFPVPFGEHPDFWTNAEMRVAADLARAALGQPKPAHAIAIARARELFDVLPVHEKIRAHDFEMYRNTLRFHLTEISAELEERGDLKGLAAAAREQ